MGCQNSKSGKNKQQYQNEIHYSNNQNVKIQINQNNQQQNQKNHQNKQNKHPIHQQQTSSNQNSSKIKKVNSNNIQPIQNYENKSDIQGSYTESPWNYYNQPQNNQQNTYNQQHYEYQEESNQEDDSFFYCDQYSKQHNKKQNEFSDSFYDQDEDEIEYNLDFIGHKQCQYCNQQIKYEEKTGITNVNIGKSPQYEAHICPKMNVKPIRKPRISVPNFDQQIIQKKIKSNLECNGKNNNDIQKKKPKTIYELLGSKIEKRSQNQSKRGSDASVIHEKQNQKKLNYQQKCLEQ